jgi:hypothetical protein
MDDRTVIKHSTKPGVQATTTAPTSQRPGSALDSHFGPKQTRPPQPPVDQCDVNPPNTFPPGAILHAPAAAPKQDTSSLLRALIEVGETQLKATLEMHATLKVVEIRLATMTAQTQQTADCTMAAVEQMKNAAGVIRLFCETSAKPTAAAAAPTTNDNGGQQYEEVTVDTIIYATDDNGQPTYKVKGGKYAKHGVRVWPEVLPLIEIDPATLKPGPNACIRTVRIVLKKYTDEKTGEEKIAPQKVVGLAR